MDPNDTERPRQRPEERFAGPQHRFDLNAVAAQLRQESRTGTTGHRQESLYKDGPTTLALFLFDAGARLAPHRTKGTVIIQAVKGRLTVTAQGIANELPAGSVLVLKPGVEHEVLAHEASEMLLTVQLDRDASR